MFFRFIEKKEEKKKKKRNTNGWTEGLV